MIFLPYVIIVIFVALKPPVGLGMLPIIEPKIEMLAGTPVEGCPGNKYPVLNNGGVSREKARGGMQKSQIYSYLQRIRKRIFDGIHVHPDIAAAAAPRKIGK
jgi:hypothetical protein